MAQNIHAKYFDTSPSGILMRLLFFPSGLVTLLVVIMLLRRLPTEEDPKVKKAARLRLSDGTQRRLSADEINRVCAQYAITRGNQASMEKEGSLKKDECPLCMSGGTGRFAGLPCGHYMHLECLKAALEQDFANCPECGWSVKALFDITPDIPGMSVL